MLLAVAQQGILVLYYDECSNSWGRGLFFLPYYSFFFVVVLLPASSPSIMEIHGNDKKASFALIELATPGMVKNRETGIRN